MNQCKQRHLKWDSDPVYIDVCVDDLKNDSSRLTKLKVEKSCWSPTTHGKTIRKNERERIKKIKLNKKQTNKNKTKQANKQTNKKQKKICVLFFTDEKFF